MDVLELINDLYQTGLQNGETTEGSAMVRALVVEDGFQQLAEIERALGPLLKHECYKKLIAGWVFREL